MKIAKGAGRPGFITTHAAALAVRNSRGQLALTEPSPDIQRAIIDGRQPVGLTLKQLMKIDIPLGWEAQRQAIA